MKKEFVIALTAYFFLFMISFFVSIILGLGKAESHHDPFSSWLYVRRSLMILIGIIIPILRNQDTLKALGWNISGKWVIITLGVGLLIGISNKGGFNPSSLVAVILALLHTFATEIFFRRYLLTKFEDYLQKVWPAILWSSFAYGLYYQTVWTTWELPLIGKIIFIFLFTALGIVFSSFYKKSGSFFVPWMMHFFGVLKYRDLL